MVQLTNAMLNTLSRLPWCFMSRARLGMTPWPPKPANTRPMPPHQFIEVISGPNRVGIGSMIDPGALVFQKPSKRMIATRMNVASDERTDGIDRSLRGRKVVGRIRKKPIIFQVSAECSGRATLSESPKSTIIATLTVSRVAHLDCPITYLKAKSSMQNLRRGVRTDSQLFVSHSQNIDCCADPPAKRLASNVGVAVERGVRKYEAREELGTARCQHELVKRGTKGGTYVWQVSQLNPTTMMVPQIQPAYENASGMDKRPTPTSTAIALKSYNVSFGPCRISISLPSDHRHSDPTAMRPGHARERHGDRQYG